MLIGERVGKSGLDDSFASAEKRCYASGPAVKLESLVDGESK
jgi:hypothetical protein